MAAYCPRAECLAGPGSGSDAAGAEYAGHTLLYVVKTAGFFRQGHREEPAVFLSPLCRRPHPRVSGGISPVVRQGRKASLPAPSLPVLLLCAISFQDPVSSLLRTVSTTKYPWVARVALRRPGSALPLATGLFRGGRNHAAGKAAGTLKTESMP